MEKVNNFTNREVVDYYKKLGFSDYNGEVLCHTLDGSCVGEANFNLDDEYKETINVDGNEVTFKIKLNLFDAEGNPNANIYYDPKFNFSKVRNNFYYMVYEFPKIVDGEEKEEYFMANGVRFTQMTELDNQAVWNEVLSVNCFDRLIERKEQVKLTIENRLNQIYQNFDNLQEDLDALKHLEKMKNISEKQLIKIKANKEKFSKSIKKTSETIEFLTSIKLNMEQEINCLKNQKKEQTFEK